MKTLDIVRVKEVRRSGHATKGRLAMIVQTTHNFDNPDLTSYAIEFIEKEHAGMAWFDDDDLEYITSVGELVDRGSQ